MTFFGGIFKFIFRLVVIALLIYALAWLCQIVYSVCQHALEKHGDAALAVDQCLSQKGPHLGTWSRKSDSHLAYPCQIDDNKWGIKIDKCDGENCTALIKDKMKKGWQIVKYLQNRGYEAVDDVAKAFIERNPIPSELLNDW
jgi:hypothetical protein